LANVNINLTGIKDDRYRAQMQSKASTIQTQLDRNKTQAQEIIAARNSID